MIILICGATHTGKTLLAQKLLEKYKYPYLSIDHLKMGLIRSKQTNLTALDNDRLTDYLWPVIREMIKTAIENKQNLIIEGCYIPFSYKNDFTSEYLPFIKFICLIFSENYIQKNYETIVSNRSVIENRPDDHYPKERMIADNRQILSYCRKNDCRYILIDKEYRFDEDVQAIIEGTAAGGIE